MNLFEEENWKLAVTSFEATNSVFNITEVNISFSITTSGHWNSAPPINLFEENWILAVTSFEETNSVFNITDGNISFSITTSGHWNSEDGEELLTS